MLDLSQFDGIEPGPWVVKSRNHAHYILAADRGKYTPFSHDLLGIAQVSRYSEDSPICGDMMAKSHLAHARAIAAIPDMIAEIRNNRAEVERLSDLSDRIMDACDNARTERDNARAELAAAKRRIAELEDKQPKWPADGVVVWCNLKDSSRARASRTSVTEGSKDGRWWCGDGSTGIFYATDKAVASWEPL